MEALYVAVEGAARVALYTRGAGCTLTHRADTTCPSPAALATDPARRFLFVATNTAELVSFSIDGATGKLRRLGAVVGLPRSDGGDPHAACYVATDRSGRWLFAAYYGGAAVTVHRIGMNGRLSERPASTVATDTGCHWAGVDASNGRAFASCIARPLPPPPAEPRGNGLFSFRFDEATGEMTRTGALTPPPPSGAATNRFGNRNARGPRHLAFHPTLPLLYSTDEQANTVSAYGTGGGGLAYVESAEMLPMDFSWPQKPAAAFGSQACEIAVVMLYDYMIQPLVELY
jgi:6-phosphogluconolactonase